MYRMSLLITLIIILLSICVAACAEPDQASTPGIYLKEVPTELVSQAKDKLENCKKDFPITEETAAEVRKVITDLDFDKPATMKTLRDRMNETGPGAVPVVDEFLLSQDDSVREKALFALRCMISDAENTVKESTATDSLLVTLLHRSILDKSLKVRQSAVIGLRNIASIRVGSVRADAITVIQEACNDSDPDLKRFAEESARAVESTDSNSDNR